jgi:hypothetical protein
VPYEGRGLTAVSLIAKLFLFFVTHKFASEKATNSEVYRWLQMKPDQLGCAGRNGRHVRQGRQGLWPGHAIADFDRRKAEI